MKKGKGPVLVLGDLHFPFQHKRKLLQVSELVYQMNPRHIVQVGDLYDQYAGSRYPRSHNILTPADEIKRGREGAEEMWWLLHRRAPKAKLWQLRGNHDVRFEARVAEKAPELASLLDVEGLFMFPHVETVMDPREELVIDGAVFIHGYMSKLGDHARYNQQNTVCGHSHAGGVVYHRNLKGIFWELNAGWLGDEKAPVFGYGSQRLSKWTTGFGVIDHHGPRFIPL